VQPHVAANVTDLTQCSGGLLLLARAVEDSVSSALHRALDAVIIKVRAQHFNTASKVLFRR
jgi:hypothetical protein